MKEEWVTTENEVYSDFEDITEQEYYRTEHTGNRFKLTSRRKMVSYHIYGHQVCEMCDNRVTDDDIHYSGYVVCGLDCLNKLVVRENAQ